MKIRKLLTLGLAAALLSASALAAPTLESVENVENGGVFDPEATELTADLATSLLYYQDFDNIEPGVYTESEIASLLSGQTSKLISANKLGWGYKPTLEVCEEADGNRYLKVTGSQYHAIAVDTGIAEADYLYMYFNYMTDENATLTEYDYNSSYSTAQYVNEGSGWGANPIKGGVSAWTKSGRITTGSRQNTNIGLAFDQGSSGTVSVCIDNVAVYSISANVNNGTVHNSALPATFTFKNSTAYESDSITMPSAVSGIVWANYYSAQKSNCVLNLSNYTPTGAPDGMEFSGWSLTDGGKAIHSVQATSFRVPGDLTFYAVWKKASPTVKVEDFESFTVGQTVTRDDFDFLNINQHNIANVTATIVLDELSGSKVLKLEGVSDYPGFAIKNRVTAAMREYLTFDYRFDSTTGNHFTMYTGTSHTGGNQKFHLTRTLTWSRAQILESNTSNAVLGGFFNNTALAAKGGYVIYLDNITYWTVPTGAESETDNNVTVTFVNSTSASPASPTLPEAYTGALWTAGAKSVLDLSAKTAIDPDGKYTFVGWSRTDGGMLVPGSDAYALVHDETLYAVWEKVAPVVMVEDFEGFTVGQTVTSADLDFLTVNQFNAANVTATVVLDEKSRSKVLKIESENVYAGFALKNRATKLANAREYLEFDFRFDTVEGSRFEMYAGTDHTGGNHKGEASRTTEWSYWHLNSNTSNAKVGGYFDNGTSGKGNFTIYIDNVYYWVVPADVENDEANNVTVKFANSTSNAPTTATLPEAVTKAIFVSGAETYINLNSFTATTTEGYRFAGWSRTDGGKVMKARYAHFNFVRDETLYAVWEKVEAPALTGEVSLRTTGLQGIRFRASAASTVTLGDNVELGFLATRNKFFTTEEAFTLDNVKNASGKAQYATGLAYKKADGVESINKLELSDEGVYNYAAVLVNIPESKANYIEQLYLRPYVKIGDVTLYGTTMHKSLYEAAKLISETEGYTALEFVESIIAVSEAE